MQKIWNWNYAGFPLALGLVGAPILVASMIYVFLSGGMKDKAGATDWVTTVIIGGMLIAGSLALVYYALTEPVVWVAFGEKLRYRQILGERTVLWNDVLAIRFDDEQSRLKLKLPGVAIPLGRHRILVIALASGKQLRIKVSHEQEQEILLRHVTMKKVPRFTVR